VACLVVGPVAQLQDVVVNAAVGQPDQHAAVSVVSGFENSSVVTGLVVFYLTTRTMCLRRDLHDGLGPGLAGVVLGLQRARKKIGSDPAALYELGLVAATRSTVQITVDRGPAAGDRR
jgi:hypothetical protein